MTELKIISGGQTGVDQAALAAAKAAGLQTGGYMPYGYMTLDGIREDLAQEHNMTECQEPGYKPRTDLNVQHSDATIRIAKYFNTPGEQCTINAIRRHKKPYLNIKWTITIPLTPIDTIIKWLNEHNIKTLNIAGNSEQSAPGITNAIQPYLYDLLNNWKLSKN